MKATIEALEKLGTRHNASFYRLTQGYKKFGQKKIGFEFTYPAIKSLGDNGLWVEFHGQIRGYEVTLVEDILQKAIKKYDEEVMGRNNKSYLCIVSNGHELMIDNHDKDFDSKRKDFYQKYVKTEE